MQVLNENSFLTDAVLEIDAISFVYNFDGLKSSIDSTFSINQQGIGTPLYFKIAFLSDKTELPNFDNSKEYYVNDYLMGDQVNVKIETNITVENVYAYLILYNKERALAKYEKTFYQGLVVSSNIVSNNFADLRISNSISLSNFIQTEKDYILQNTLANQKDKYNKSYISNLFYILKKNKNVVVFFGVDQEGYFKDNNFISFLNKDQDFNNYLIENDFIKYVKAYVYNSKDKTYFEVQQPGINGLENLFGTFYQGNFTLSGDQFKKENFSFNVEIGMIDATTEYASESLIPKLEQERKFLSSLRTDLVPFVKIQRNKIVKTLDGLSGIITSNFTNTQDKLFLYNNSSFIAVNESLKNYLTSINKQLTDLIEKNVDYEKRNSSKLTTIQRNFEKTIDVRDAERAVEVVSFDEQEGSINTISVEKYSERANLEIQKYFEEGGSEIQTKSGLQTPNLQSLALSYLSAESYYVKDKKVLSNDKNVFYDFSYDDFLNYVKAINEIIANDINYDIRLSIADEPERVTIKEYQTEQTSKQLTFNLNSLIVTQIPNLKTEMDREEYLQGDSNVVKTFEIPSNLTTDLCVDNISPSDITNNGSRQIQISPQNFLGNNLFAFTIFNKIEPFYLKNFYEFYRAYEQVELDINTLPIQSLFLYRYYRNELSSPSFLNKQELYKSFVVYGIIYFMFKTLFRVTILLPSENDYVILTEEILNSLDPGQKYMCQMDYYDNHRLGVKTPKLLQTSIYNRYFILEA